MKLAFLTAIKLALGLFFLLLGLGYLYRPVIMSRIHTLLRDTVFNDAYIMLERKKWGFFFLLMGTVFVYMGWSALGRP